MIKNSFVCVILIGILLVGCTKVQENRNSDIEKPCNTSRIEVIERIEHPSMDIYVEEEPLVRRTLNYSLDGTLGEVYEYEYDDFNRKAHVYYRYYDEDKKELIDCYTYNYSYDESYRYEEMIYHLLGDKSAFSTYDARRDEIQIEFYSKEGEFISFVNSFEYEFEDNIIRKKIWVDDYERARWTVIKYDDLGNIIYYGHTNNAGEVEDETIITYTYDEENRIVHEVRDDYDSNGYPSQTIRDYVYEGDLLIKEIEQNRLNIGFEGMEIVSSEEIVYTYDEEGRLLYKRYCHISDSVAGGHRESGYFMIYEYEIMNDEIPLMIDINSY